MDIYLRDLNEKVKAEQLKLLKEKAGKGDVHSIELLEEYKADDFYIVVGEIHGLEKWFIEN